ncbi:MAG: hypothetical protein K2L25_04050 [Alphaproteobacteria bacterium]|nr:hypothetical protein [Alphaproteobacteria bacterium]
MHTYAPYIVDSAVGSPAPGAIGNAWAVCTAQGPNMHRGEFGANRF